MHSKLIALVAVALTSSAWAACDHPYYPAALGMSWTYSLGLTGSNLETTTRVVSADAQRYVAETVTKTSSTREEVKCQSDGSLIRATYISSFESNSQSAKGQFITDSGVTIPAPQLWVIGTQWTYTMKSRYVANFKAESVVQTDTTETVHSKIVGVELIAVPAGKFRALKVMQTTQSNATVAQNGKATTSKENSTGTFWYARGVGVVKSSGKDFTYALTSFIKI